MTKTHPVQIDGYDRLDDVVTAVEKMCSRELMDFLRGFVTSTLKQAEADEKTGRVKLASALRGVSDCAVNENAAVFDDASLKLGIDVAELRYDAISYIFTKLNRDKRGLSKTFALTPIVDAIDSALKISYNYMQDEFSKNPPVAKP